MARVLRSFEYLELKTVEEAVRFLSMYGKETKLLAGGTDLVVSIRRGDISPQ